MGRTERHRENVATTSCCRMGMSSIYFHSVNVKGNWLNVTEEISQRNQELKSL